MKLGYRPALDGIRAFAVLAVVASHFDPAYFGAGFMGVDVFFVISGFLITRLLCEEHDSHGSVDLRSFWWRRAYRLMPAVWVLLAFVAAFGALGVFTKVDGDDLATLFYFRNWVMAFGGNGTTATGHTWSLAVEEQFYVLWPLAFVAVMRWRGRRGVVIVAAAGASISAIETALIAGHVSWSRMLFSLDGRAALALLAGAALGASTIVRVPRLAAWVAALIVLSREVVHGGLSVGCCR